MSSPSGSTLHTGKEGGPPPPEPLLISGEQAAEMLGICPRTLGALTASGQIPSLKLGRRRLYSPDTLRAWVVQRMRMQPPAAAESHDGIAGEGAAP